MTFVVEELKAVFDPRGGSWMKGRYVPSLLAAIGRDCVGALQFLPDTLSPDDIAQSTGKIEGEPVDEEDIGRILNNLARAPLGLDEDDAFRISVAGAQEKTALLHYEGRWLKPIGTTPTTHIFKPQIGQLPNGIDLSNSVENEFYCLQLMKAFGLPVNEARIESFTGTLSPANHEISEPRGAGHPGHRRAVER